MNEKEGSPDDKQTVKPDSDRDEGFLVAAHSNASRSSTPGFVRGLGDEIHLTPRVKSLARLVGQ
jgi:hypothetical protein